MLSVVSKSVKEARYTVLMAAQGLEADTVEALTIGRAVNVMESHAKVPTCGGSAKLLMVEWRLSNQLRTHSAAKTSVFGLIRQRARA
jgi:hypothetical protein